VTVDFEKGAVTIDHLQKKVGWILSGVLGAINWHMTVL
jgi:hypothetical protein